MSFTLWVKTHLNGSSQTSSLSKSKNNKVIFVYNALLKSLLITLFLIFLNHFFPTYFCHMRQTKNIKKKQLNSLTQKQNFYDTKNF